MKKINCEMCGSSSLVEENGVLVCEYCGMRYSLKTSRKTKSRTVEPIEPVEYVPPVVPDPPILDDSALMQKYLVNARQALDKEDWEDTEKYYSLVKRIDPYNGEAVFFSSFGKAMFSLYSYNYTRREQSFNILKNTIPLIDKCYKAPDGGEEKLSEDKAASLQRIAEAIVKMNNSGFFYSSFIEVGKYGSKAWQEKIFCTIRDDCLTELEKICVNDKKLFNDIKNLIDKGRLDRIKYYLNVGREACYIDWELGRDACNLDWRLARDHYTVVEVEDPYNIEALFFVPFCDFMVVAKEEPGCRLTEKKVDKLKEKISLIHTYYDLSSEDKQDTLKRIVHTVAQIKRCLTMLSSQAIKKADINSWEELSFYRIKKALSAEFKILSREHPNEAYIKELKATVSSFTYGHCYIATAVYGSYDCPQVWTLRRFRDNTLASVWYGRAFIKVYYALSPILVKYFGSASLFKNICRAPLDYMVKELNTKGFEDTPYHDIL
ncbi:MAG: CFI-box-CTERM domain-containing protein [Candidatus Bruticola sp.]